MERTKEERILILEVLISERMAIISGIEYELKAFDSKFDYAFMIPYKEVLNSQISNHKLALNEYQEGLKKLKQ